MVLISNVVGAGIIAWVMGTTEIFKTRDARLAKIASLTMQDGSTTVMMRRIFAGWIIATMVWMTPSLDNSRPVIIICMTYLVALGEFPGVVSSVDGIFLVVSGMLSWGSFLGRFLLLTAIGNTIGGVLLVSSITLK